ncbi:putative leader peptide [Streptomyces sp. NPDC001515]
MRTRHRGERAVRPPRHGRTFDLRVLRRHVDLLRVSSALCPTERVAR